jgi:hypothetical protein
MTDPYLHNLPHHAARVLALSELIYSPDEDKTQYIFDGGDIGAGDDEVIVVTYERRKKKQATAWQENIALTPIMEYA